MTTVTTTKCVFVGLLTCLVLAAPARAHSWDRERGPFGAANDCRVTYREAKRVTRNHIGNYHGGVRHFAGTLAIPWCTTGRVIGVRANDDAWLFAHVTIRKGRYFLFMGHEDD